MSEEWGTPVSKEKIIARRNRLIEYQKLGELRFTPLYEAIDENILDINYMIYEIERLNKKIEQYENPEDMTLMFMWCDEKAKDEIKRLNNIIKEVRELVENGTDFKSIYFKKGDKDTWKIILASHIKENFLEILDKGE